MQAFNITPDKLAKEMSDFANKLGNGVQNLMDIGEIDEGVTNRVSVYKEDNVTLYRYESSADVVKNKTPLLIVYALVNRPYMADIQEDRSTIKNLLNHGQDVYLIDWGYPDEADRALTMGDYINGYIDRCVDVICKRHQLEKINLLGICQGGSFSLCYTSLHQEKVNSLITMVTPVDFKTKGNLLSDWVQHIDVDTLVDTLGNIPGDMLNYTFLSMKPFALTGQKYLAMIDILEDEDKLKNFMRMEKWIFDSPDQAGETFRQFIKDFYQKNGFINGGVELDGEIVDLKNISCPILNVFAEQDHLVPPLASKALKKLTKSKDYTELSFPGGHIGIYVSGRAQSQVTPAISTWLEKHK